MFIAGYRAEDISDFCRIRHPHYAESIISRLQRPERIDFRNQYVGAKPFGPLGYALAAAAISANHKGFSGIEEVRGA